MSKVFQAGDYEAIHANPVWRDKANFIIAVYLGERDGRSEWEQLWAHRLGQSRFSICCIPFFAFDLALGDEVETDDGYLVQKVIKASGQFTFRVWFGDSMLQQVKNELVKYMESQDVEMEWSSENLLALSACDAEQAQRVADYMQIEQDRGRLSYETGRTF